MSAWQVSIIRLVDVHVRDLPMGTIHESGHPSTNQPDPQTMSMPGDLILQPVDRLLLNGKGLEYRPDIIYINNFNPLAVFCKLVNRKLIIIHHISIVINRMMKIINS